MPINRNELTKEMIEKAMQCKNAEELIALAKTGGYELTKEEAEAYLAEMFDIELDDKALKNVAVVPVGIAWTIVALTLAPAGIDRKRRNRKARLLKS